MNINRLDIGDLHGMLDSVLRHVDVMFNRREYTLQFGVDMNNFCCGLFIAVFGISR